MSIPEDLFLEALDTVSSWHLKPEDFAQAYLANFFAGARTACLNSRRRTHR